MAGLQQRPDVEAAGREARVLTWNINGLKKVAASHGGLKELLDQFNADIGANCNSTAEIMMLLRCLRCLHARVLLVCMVVTVQG